MHCSGHLTFVHTLSSLSRLTKSPPPRGAVLRSAELSDNDKGYPDANRRERGRGATSARDNEASYRSRLFFREKRSQTHENMLLLNGNAGGHM